MISSEMVPRRFIRLVLVAKQAAWKAGVGVFQIPTSMATCAAFTCVSIMYTEEGAYRDSLRFDYEVA